jgi:hypothetical protein
MTRRGHSRPSYEASPRAHRLLASDVLRTVSVEGLFSCRLITIFGYIVCEITGGFHIQRFRQRGHPSHPLRPLVSVRYTDVHCG